MPQQITTQQRITLTLSNSESQRERVLSSSHSDRIHIDAPYACRSTLHIAGIMSILVTEMDAGSVTQYKIHIPEFDTMECVCCQDLGHQHWLKISDTFFSGFLVDFITASQHFPGWLGPIMEDKWAFDRLWISNKGDT